jgi:hypothetical protein
MRFSPHELKQLNTKHHRADARRSPGFERARREIATGEPTA